MGSFTTTLREGPHKGLTALTGSSQFLTDQRNFSNNRRASSRMHSEARVDLTVAPAAMGQTHRCDKIIECDARNGEIIREHRVSTSQMKFVLTDAAPLLSLELSCKSANPRAQEVRGFAEIEYRGDVVIDIERRSIMIDFMICLFPAFEAYAAINDGAGVVLFRHAPPPGILASSLPAGAKRRIRSRLEVRDVDGVFEFAGAQL
jgi:hypothetical protein